MLNVQNMLGVGRLWIISFHISDMFLETGSQFAASLSHIREVACFTGVYLVASRGQEVVSVASRGDRSKCISCVPGLQPQVYELRPAVRKEMYQLRPRLSASCI